MRPIFALIFLVLLSSCTQEEPRLVQLRRLDFNVSPQGSWISGKSISYCQTGSNIRVVDTGDALSRSFLERMREIGVEAVIRYYGYDRDNPPPDGRRVSNYQNQKTLKLREVELLREFGMASVAVFQFRGYFEDTFKNWEQRAEADASRALKMAEALGQPPETPIYFSVDADLINPWARNKGRTCRSYSKGKGYCESEIRNYFAEVSKALREQNYATGVYGSGETCRLLTEGQLVSTCWLNHSGDHAGREWALASDKVVLLQLAEATKAPLACGSRNVDFNWIKSDDFGQFKF